MTINHELSHAVKIGIMNYVNEGYPIGHFLTAVFSNDLFEAFSRADSQSAEGLEHLVRFIYNECPSGCHGSKEKVLEWKGYKCLSMNEDGELIGSKM